MINMDATLLTCLLERSLCFKFNRCIYKFDSVYLILKDTYRKKIFQSQLMQ